MCTPEKQDLICIISRRKPVRWLMTFFLICLASLQAFAQTDNRALMVPIQTRIIANDGSKGTDYSIKVGTTPYPAPDGSGPSGFQVLFLNRQDLSMVDNRYVDGGSDTDVSNLFFVQPNCGPLGCLVIIQSLQTIGPVSDENNEQCGPCQLFLALLEYGAKLQLVNTANLNDSNTAYSLINTLNPAPGNAYERRTCFSTGSNCFSVEQSADKGAISGNLILDNLGGYTFAYPGRVPFSTGTGGSSYRNAMIIGQNLGNPATHRGTYRSTAITDRSGFQIVVLARDTLALISNNTYSFSPSNTGGLQQATQLLTQVANSSNQMAMLSSIGDLSGYSNSDPWIQFGRALESIGGNFHVIDQLQTADDYSLVGWGGASILTGAVEASTVISKATRTSVPPSNIRGVLRQDHFGDHAPVYSNLGSSFTQSTTNMLDAIAFQPAFSSSGFPTWNGAGLNAYSALSTAVSGNPDVRSLYTDQSQNPATWLTLAKSATCNGSTTYCSDDFEPVRQQLIQEFTGLSGIYAFRSNLETFYTQLQFTQTGALDAAYNAVNAALAPPPDTGVAPLWQSIFGDAGNVVSAVVGLASPEAYVGLDIVFTAADTAMEYASSPATGNPFQQLQTTFGQLQEQTQAAFTANLATVNRLFDLVTTDWGRIQRLGGQLNNGNIRFDSNDQTAAQTALAVSARRQYFTKLIPVNFNMADWYHLDWGKPATLSKVCEDWEKDPCHLDNSDPENWISIETTLTDPDGAGWDVWKIGQGQDALCQSSNDHVLLAPLFAPVNGSDPSQLGIYKPYFFKYLTQPIYTYQNLNPRQGDGACPN
jgi:hypothetical protein